MKNLTNSQPRIEIIETFLSGWASKAETTYLEILQKGFELDDKWFAKAREFGSVADAEKNAEYKALSTQRAKYWENLPKYLRVFKSKSFKHVAPQIREMIAKDVDSKRSKLYNEVTEKIGLVVDAKGLSVGSDGSINGLIIGETGTARITTITAGGYNIQCLHYRLLIKVIK